MKIIDKLNIPNNKCPYCDFEDKFGNLCGKSKLEEGDPYEEDFAQLKILGPSKRNPVAHPVLEISTEDGIYMDFKVSHCPWCGRRLSE